MGCAKICDKEMLAKEAFPFAATPTGRERERERERGREKPQLTGGRRPTIKREHIMGTHANIPSIFQVCMHVFIYMRGKAKEEKGGRQTNTGFLCESERHKRMSHIAVERNRRRQMNEHIKVLRSLTPSFYIKRGDQASIIGGAIEFIKELHQVLQSLEAKKRRKSLSPCPTPSPRPLLQLTPSPSSNNTYDSDIVKELGACCNSPVADVEAKISGSNVLLRTLSKHIPGQVIKITTVLEKLALEILHLNISSMEDNVLYSFVIKIGFDCQLSVEELAFEVQQSFYQDIAY